MQFKQSDLESWILLSKVSSAGFSGVNRLLEEVGSPEKIFTTPLEKLSQVSKIDKRIIDFIKNKIVS